MAPSKSSSSNSDKSVLPPSSRWTILIAQSNPTYLLKTPNKSYVLRRAPSGPLLSPTAHRIDREYLILDALNRYNASLKEVDRAEKGVPIPEVYCLCMDKEVVGAGFYVMNFLEGRIFQNIFMKEVSDEDRRAWYARLLYIYGKLTIQLAIDTQDINQPFLHPSHAARSAIIVRSSSSRETVLSPASQLALTRVGCSIESQVEGGQRDRRDLGHKRAQTVFRARRWVDCQRRSKAECRECGPW